MDMNMGIDFGTTTTRIFVKGHGIVLQEPSIVAVRTDTNQIVAVGCTAEKLVRETRSARLVRFIRNGAIADVDMAAEFLRICIDKVCMGQGGAEEVGNCHLFIAVPDGCTSVERQVFEAVAHKVGVDDVRLVGSSIATAIGVGLDVDSRYASVIADVGSSIVEAAVISRARVVRSNCMRAGGDAMCRDIRNYLKFTHDLIIEGRTAESIKTKIGLISTMSKEMRMKVCGLCGIRDRPKSIDVSAQEIQGVMGRSASNVVDMIREMFCQCKPELAVDFVDKGLVLTGGGALLLGLNRFVEDRIGVKVCLAGNPFTATIEGLGKIMED